MSSSYKMGIKGLFNSRGAVLKSAYALFAIFSIIAIVWFVVGAFAAHNSEVTINPTIVAGSQNDVLFTVSVCNNIESSDPIHEFRIYYEWQQFTDFKDVHCQPKKGWDLKVLNTLWGHACVYSSTASQYNIAPGTCETDSFSFTADTPETECCRDLRFETRDTANNWVFHDLSVCVDTTPPETTKTYGEPNFPEGEHNAPHWITTDTPITLEATDTIGPYDSGVEETWYKNVNKDNVYFKPTDQNFNFDWYCESKDNCEQWIPCEKSLQQEQCPGWTEYTGPFTKKEPSCHIIEYYSVDGVGNKEDIKWQCVYVEDTPPIVDKEVGEPWGYEGYYGEYFDLPADHPDVEGKITGYVPGDSPFNHDWYDYKYFVFARGDPNLEFGENFFPLDEEYPEDPHNYYFAVHWNAKITVDETGDYDFFLNSDDDSWVYIDDKMVGDYGGIHPAGSGITKTVYLEEGKRYDIDVYFAERHKVQSYMDFHWVTEGVITKSGWFVSPESDITFTCTDPDPHPVDHEIINWKIDIDGEEGEWQSADAPHTIHFTEDSNHELYYYCEDALKNKEDEHIQWHKVDATPPTITKELIGPKEGDCLPESKEDECYITNETIIRVTVTDPDPTGMECNSGVDYCKWWYEWNGEEYQGGEFTDTVDITFNEDSAHKLHIECYDKVENYAEDIETFLVDIEPPETTKRFGDPFFLNKGAEWISTETLIHLDPVDEKSGVDKTWYANIVFEDPEDWNYCYYPKTCPDYVNIEDQEWYVKCGLPKQNWCKEHWQEGWEGQQFGSWQECTEFRVHLQCDVPKDWHIYIDPFLKEEESCHVLYYFSIDNLGNWEPMKKNCFFVDDTPPIVDKEVGEPKVECDPEDPNECDYYVTQNTEITFTCEDQGPHPLNDVTIYWEIYLWENDEWKSIGDYSEHSSEASFKFKEDSKHKVVYWCEDALEHSSDIKEEIDIVDTEEPIIETEIVGPQYKDFIDGITIIEVNAEDPEPHPVNDVTCHWGYYLDEEEEMYGWYDEFPIHFPEDTTHYLIIECWDKLGNKAIYEHTYYVDKTPPTTSKSYGEPYFEEGGVEWITSETPVTLTVEDTGPHMSGIKATYYKDVYLPEEEDWVYCYEACEQWIPSKPDDEGWLEWTGEPFYKEPESCHIIEYYSVDNVDKVENVKWQCVFVDNTPPTPLKEVGEPKEPWDGEGAIYYDLDEFCQTPGNCWKITLLTPISMSCVDPEPHPVDHERICFKVELDGDDMTEMYCGEQYEQYYDGNYDENDDGYCCLDNEIEDFYFNEESEHNLAFYCEDALYNRRPIDDEKFKVEGTKFEIEINKKWNLISTPVVLIDGAMSAIFGDNNEKYEAVWTYDPEHVLCGLDWCIYSPDDNSGNDNLNTMVPGSGYWVLAYNNTELIIGGSLMSPGKTPPSKGIVKGWNLIGYYGTEGSTKYDGPNLDGEGKPAWCALYSIGEDVWDKGFTSLWTYWEPYNPKQWIPLDQYDYMNPGAGYWISSSSGGIYTPSTISCGPGGPIE